MPVPYTPGVTVDTLGRVRSDLGAHAAHQRPGLVDAGLALLYAAVFLGLTMVQFGEKTFDLPLVARSGAPGFLGIQPTFVLFSRAAIGFVAVCAVALAWWRARPEPAFLVIVGVAALQIAVREPISFWDIAMPIALFSAAAYASRIFARLALAVAILEYVGIWAMEVDLLGRLDRLPNPLDVLGTTRGATSAVLFALLILVWAMGDQVRAARERLERDLERAAQAAREQEAHARLGALAERSRIARELHDVVAHGLSVMIVQADGALYAEADHPDAPRQALATIASTGRESLGEMRRLLGVLRDDPDAEQLAPQPELASLPALIDRFRASGLDVRYAEERANRPVPAAVGLTAYRVVQEALTNVLHHAGPTRVEVRVGIEADVLKLFVVNDPGARPPRAAGTSPGLGLVGMRERVGLLDGQIDAGPTPQGGFQVAVELPVRAATAEPDLQVRREHGRPPAAPEADPDASRSDR